MYEIIPSPGTENKSFAEIANKIELVRPFAKTIHIDICDGKFAPNVTFADPAPFAPYTKDFIFEVHLMVEEPIHHLKRWADVGFQRFIGQIEMMSSQTAFVAEAQLLGDVGLAVDGPTSLDAVKVSYDDVDLMFFYTADRAGYSGKPFQEDRLDKVKALRAQMPYLPIEVDGGITEETIAVAAAAGVNRFVATSFLFNIETPQKQFQLLHQSLESLAIKA